MMTLLSPVFLSIMALIPDNDCMLSSDVVVMPNDDLTESSVSVMAFIPDNDCAFVWHSSHAK